jgi:hypothetical protein
LIFTADNCLSDISVVLISLLDVVESILYILPLGEIHEKTDFETLLGRKHSKRRVEEFIIKAGFLRGLESIELTT